MFSHTADLVFFVGIAFFGSIVSISDAAYVNDGYRAEGAEHVSQPSSSVVGTAHGRTPRRTVSRGALTLISITAASILSLYVILSCFRSIRRNVDNRWRQLAVGGDSECSVPSAKQKKVLDGVSFDLGSAQMELSFLALSMKSDLCARQPSLVQEALGLAHALLNTATQADDDLRELSGVLLSLLETRPDVYLLAAEDVGPLSKTLEELATRKALQPADAALVSNALKLAKNVEARKYEGDLNAILKLAQHVRQLLQKGLLEDDSDGSLRKQFERLEDDMGVLLADNSRAMVEYRIRVRAYHISRARLSEDVKSTLDLRAELQEVVDDLRVLQEMGPPAPLPFPEEEITLIVEEFGPFVEKIKSAGFESKYEKAKSIVDRARALLEARSAAADDIQILAYDLREMLLDTELRTIDKAESTTTPATSQPTSTGAAAATGAVAAPVSPVSSFLDRLTRLLRDSPVFSSTLRRCKSMGDLRSGSGQDGDSPATASTSSKRLSKSTPDLRPRAEGDP